MQNMRKNLCIACALAAILAIGCSRHSGLGVKALPRLQKVVDREMSEKMHVKGRIKLKGVKTIYDCDSLCLIQCMAVYTDSLGAKSNYPLRYVYIRDNFMSMATGHPTYNEGLFYSEPLTGGQIKTKRTEIREQGAVFYENLVGVTLPIRDEF